ncbi:DUF2141 domain-containing protein [Algibacter sp.]|uniref:DUF2141 domain-containing protein n=1 Tax=Algibacter sp. TaxID=1872428 RepID=UPI003C766ABC
MKTLTLIIALVLSVNLSYAQDSKTLRNITVTIENIVNNNGHVILGLHTENTFMKGEAITSAVSQIVHGKITVTFENVDSGTYAIMALHDQNDNKRMDFQDNGMPKESYGMSNNPINYGPPQFTSAKFDLIDEDLDLKIIF